MKPLHEDAGLPDRRTACLMLAGVLWGSAAQRRRRGGSVRGIDLSLALPRTDVISGETLLLNAVVSNRSSQTVEIQTSPHVPIDYEFRDPDGNLRYSTSEAAYFGALAAGLQLPPQTTVTAKLAPGQSRRFRQDPALYLGETLAPGKYFLSASLEVGGATVESPPVEINVSAARLSHLAFSYCAFANSMVAVFDHADGAGRSWVFSRQTSSVQLQAGVAVRLEAAAEGRKIQHVGATVHVAPRLMGRWTGWLEAGSLRLVGPGVGPHPAPVPIALAEPRLAHPGFYLGDGSAVFIVTGIEEGRAKMQLVKATRERAAAAPPAVLYQTLPERVLARWEEEQGGEPVLRLVWADRAGDETRVFVRPYSLAGKTLAAGPKQIYARAAGLLALELDPLGGGPGWAHALFDPPQPNQGPVYVRIPLAGAPARSEESRVAAPPKPVGDWAISGQETGGLLVLARIEDRIWVASARGRQWAPLTGPVGEVRYLHLAASLHDYWGALWVDPSSGLRYISDPAFRARA